MKNNKAIFIRSDGGKFKISKNALTCMEKFIQHVDCQNESGGVLLGRYIINSNDIVVDEITKPTSEDKAGRFFFFRKQKKHQGFIKRIWNETEGTCNYLGEWHTHPEDCPNPSTQDIVNWKKLLRKTKFEEDYLYFVILGRKKLVVWEGNKKSLKITKMKQSCADKGKKYE